MARDRHQQGWVEEVGKKVKKWRGHYFVYIQAHDGGETRSHKVITLGLKSGLRKWEAEKKLKEFLEGQAGLTTAKPDSTVTLEWFWKTRFLPLQVSWRKSTHDAVEFVMRRHVLAKFGETPLADLTRFDLQTYLNGVAAKYSKSLVDKVRTWTRAVLEEAVEQEYLSKNPARKLSMPPTRDVCKRFLTGAEYQKILGALHGRDKIIFRLFVFTALRPGELFALRWKCFRSDSLIVEEAVYRGRLGEPKTKGSRAFVMIPRSLAEELEQWYEDSGCPGPDDFIFPSETNRPIDGHNYLRRDVLRPAAESVGVRGVTFQSLRRTFATHFHRIGTVKDQQSQMRHTNAQTTMNIYTQAVSDSLRSAMETFDERMSKSF